MDRAVPQLPSRRALLAAAVLAGLAGGLLGGCTDDLAERTAAARAGAQELAVRSTVSDSELLRQGALALAARYSPGTASRRLYDALAADHLTHLTALGSPAEVSPSPTGTSAAPSASGSPTGSRSTSPTGTPTMTVSASPGAAVVPASPAALLDAEWTAARRALRLGLDEAAGGLAQLLVRVAAGRAAHADLIAGLTGKALPGELLPDVEAASPPGSPSASPSGSPSGTVSDMPSVRPSSSSPAGSSSSPSVTTPAPGSVLASPTDRAVNRLLAGEHAALFAYPVVIARSAGARRDLARDLWDAHRDERDELTARQLAAGVEPEQSLPAYRIEPMPATAREAAELAAELERALAAQAADVTATAAPGADRDLGARHLVLATRRTAAWSGTPTPLTRSTPSPTGSPTSSG